MGLLGSFFSAVCAVLWVTLGLTAVGLVRLTITFNIVQHDKTLDRGIRAVDAINDEVLMVVLLLGVQT